MMTTNMQTQAQMQQVLHEDILKDILTLDVKKCNITVCLASVEQDALVPRFKLLDLIQNRTDDFQGVVTSVIEHYKKEWQKNAHFLRSFDVVAKLDEHEIEHIDLSTYDSIVKQIEPLSQPSGFKSFMEEKEFSRNLRFYAIVVQPLNGQPVIFYRRYTHKLMLDESPYFVLRRLIANEHQYNRVIEPAFLFDKHIDCIGRGNDMFILRKDSFYYIFRFIEELEKTADQTLALIKGRDLIVNFGEFEKSCKSNKNKLFKLKNISITAYLNNITINDMEKSIIKHKLNVPIELHQGKRMVRYESRNTYGILKLLDDDYLSSDMTQLNYETNSKRNRQ